MEEFKVPSLTKITTVKYENSVLILSDECRATLDGP